MPAPRFFCPFCERDDLPRSAFRDGARICKSCERVAQRT